jgi:sec-independent protein translocase protein TatA
MLKQLGAPEIILILVVLVLLFGAKRLPDASRSIGRSLRIFKSEMKEMRTDDDGDGRPQHTTDTTAPRPIEAGGPTTDETTGRRVADPDRREL